MTSDSQTSPALLIFSLGPVQDFIAAARRTQDLWMGSYLLSYLAAHAMKTVRDGLKDQAAYHIIFPTPENQPLLDKLDDKPVDPRELALASLPNKFTAKAPSQAVGEQLAKDAADKIGKAWTEVVAHVWPKFPEGLLPATWPDGRRADANDWKSVWDRQVKPDWIEIYWVVYPEPPDANYGEWSRRAERAFEARKGLRNFHQPLEAEIGEKSTLDGKLAALGATPNKRRPQLRDEWKALAEELRKRSQAGGGDDDDADNGNPYRGLDAALNVVGDERLDGISTVKRFVQRFYFQDDNVLGLRGGFPSTSSIATAIFRRQLLEEPGAAGVRRDFVNTLRKHRIPRTLPKGAYSELGPDPLNRYDGDLFYPETYTLKYLREDYGVDFGSETNPAPGELRSSLGQLLRAAREVKPKPIASPPKYYAVLMMDGDRLGKTLGEAQSEDEQKQVSQCLRNFASRVRGIVEDKDHLGRVVYAGGDDLMAFLPLESALDAAGALRAAFRKAMQESTLGQRITISAGIAVAHHQAPLDSVLAAARQAEHRAKEEYGRDALVVTVLKRSGEQLDVGAPWECRGVQPVELVAKVYQLIQADQLSAKFAYDAEREARALNGLGREAHERMLARLLGRHGVEKKDASSLAEQWARLGEGLGRADAKLPDETSPTLEVARWLLLARFVAAARGEE